MVEKKLTWKQQSIGNERLQPQPAQPIALKILQIGEFLFFVRNLLRVWSFIDMATNCSGFMELEREVYLLLDSQTCWDFWHKQQPFSEPLLQKLPLPQQGLTNPQLHAQRIKPSSLIRKLYVAGRRKKKQHINLKTHLFEHQNDIAKDVVPEPYKQLCQQEPFQIPAGTLSSWEI